MRTSSGNTRKLRHKKILNATKGYRMTKSKLYRVAHEAFLHAGQYSFNDRRKRMGQMRSLWIKRLNAAAVLNGFKYNELVSKMKKANVTVNRKVLAEIAFRFPETFSKFVKSF
jgi:large subunit ribosomal protein L20